MDSEFEKQYHDYEESHFWFKGRRHLLLQLIKDYPSNAKILDIGCSGGVLLAELQKNNYHDISGVDISPKAIALAKQRDVGKIYQSEAILTPFPDSYFDIVIASDILEHLPDDSLALKEWQRILKPNGLMIIGVPAFQFLYSIHDQINHHYRRYDKKDLLKLLNNFPALKIIFFSYWGLFLFVPIWFRSIFYRSPKIIKLNKKNYFKINNFVNNFIYNLVKIENYFIKKNISLPFGTSIIIVLKRNNV
jgi:SAM-dependent methyltransferase